MATTRREAIRGAALLLCMVFTAAVLTPLTVLALRTTSHVRHAQYAAMEASALAGAEAALEIARLRIESGESGSVGYSGFLNWDPAGSIHLTHFPDSITPESFPGTPPVKWITVARNPKSLPDGWFAVYAIARAGSVRRCVEGVFRPTENGKLARVSWREMPMNKEDGDPNAAF
ncbi:MAG: hypothetical protein JNK74_25605 [Candidatus Hydrogenedentes bacterium]|nr:hypothetical protein [Candidatus Hydrogenedentota bacterium]